MSIDELLALIESANERIATYTMVMTTQYAVGEVTASGAVDVTDPKVRSHLRMQLIGQDLEVITLGEEVYVLSDEVGESWVRLSIEQAVEMGLYAPDNPVGMLEAFRSAYQEIEFVGPESVDGTMMRHYAIALDPSRLVDLPDDPGMDSFTVDLWFDEDGFTRKQVVDSGGGYRMELVTANINQPVTIEAPEDWVEMPR
ncbi:MAG: hypothetical protein KIT69_15910 [Propionibacteriaceae bacterium]|nr:hypothetical protein [Propionibacteriaceae bacterium]